MNVVPYYLVMMTVKKAFYHCALVESTITVARTDIEIETAAHLDHSSEVFPSHSPLEEAVIGKSWFSRTCLKPPIRRDYSQTGLGQPHFSSRLPPRSEDRSVPVVVP